MKTAADFNNFETAGDVGDALIQGYEDLVLENLSLFETVLTFEFVCHLYSYIDYECALKDDNGDTCKPARFLELMENNFIILRNKDFDEYFSAWEKLNS